MISSAASRCFDFCAFLRACDPAQEEQDEHLRLLLPLFREHLPEKLVDVAFDRVPTTLPPQYLRNAMASCLACTVVYKEGERGVFDSAFAVWRFTQRKLR